MINSNLRHFLLISQQYHFTQIEQKTIKSRGLIVSDLIKYCIRIQFIFKKSFAKYPDKK